VLVYQSPDGKTYYVVLGAHLFTVSQEDVAQLEQAGATLAGPMSAEFVAGLITAFGTPIGG
jgi:hypothetical protein